MIKRCFRKYFAILFVLATLMSVFHHHSDMQLHEDCQICLLQSNISDADMPNESDYVGKIQKISYDLEVVAFLFDKRSNYTSLYPRAPPKNS